MSLSKFLHLSVSSTSRIGEIFPESPILHPSVAFRMFLEEFLCLEIH